MKNPTYSARMKRLNLLQGYPPCLMYVLEKFKFTVTKMVRNLLPIGLSQSVT